MSAPRTVWSCSAVVIVAVLGFCGCRDMPSADTRGKSSPPTVYAAGSYDNGQKTVPCYWEGTKRIDLPSDDSRDAQANNVFVPPWGAVYTAGYRSEGNKRIPCRWVGAQRTDLPGSDGGEASSIFVSSRGWPYAGGYYLGKAGTQQVPCYWAGTTRIDLPGSPAGGAVLAIFVSGKTIYAAGYYQDWRGLVPCYWAGTARTDLPCSPHGGQATSIFVREGVVYTAGIDGGTPCYWEGKSQTLLSGRGPATWISAAGGNIYTGGQSLIGGACYWVGTIETDLPSDGMTDSAVSSIVVSADTVYSAGVCHDGSIDVPCLWTGSRRTGLPRSPQGAKVAAVRLF
jgi:hypothetical protein